MGEAASGMRPPRPLVPQNWVAWGSWALAGVSRALPEGERAHSGPGPASSLPRLPTSRPECWSQLGVLAASAAASDADAWGQCHALGLCVPVTTSGLAGAPSPPRGPQPGHRLTRSSTRGGRGAFAPAEWPSRATAPAFPCSYWPAVSVPFPPSCACVRFSWVFVLCLELGAAL